jgi:RimJ/RimL family protein N-acetyltransferase
MTLVLRDFNEEMLRQSFDWLNDPEIKLLSNAPDITKEKQQNWFHSLRSREDYLIKSIYADNEPIGVIGLKKIDEKEKIAEYFGYIGNKAYWGKGIGNWMMDKVIKIAEEKQLLKIYLHVIVENYVAINLYFKKGFTIKAYKEGNYIMHKFLK